jgi:DNA invertase Pin-like site-specific DNA recombinase
MRIAIYARYSSDQQSDASIDDQIRLCKERIAREGWSLEQVYRDAAISGASTLRPGYQAMLEGVRDGGFDIVLAEALDRLSRDQEDVAGLYKRLRFAGVRLITLAEGEISELHIGLKGTMNALFLKDLADKTRRGLRGRVAAGKSAGGIAYGYKVVRSVDAHGEQVRAVMVVSRARSSAAITAALCVCCPEADSPLPARHCRFAPHLGHSADKGNIPKPDILTPIAWDTTTSDPRFFKNTGFVIRAGGYLTGIIGSIVGQDAGDNLARIA